MVIGLFVYFLIGLLTPPALAQEGWRFASFGEEYDAADAGEVNQGAYTDRSMQGSMASLACLIMPIGPSQKDAADGLCTNDPNKLGVLYQRSAIGYINRYFTVMYTNPPATTYAFLRDSAISLGFVPKPAYAQGVGFSSLSPLLAIWKIFRNIAYALLAVVMIIIGFMVMLRKKIDPKTVVTVQNALPKIVLTLILITFSYAIVGLMIDLMYLIMLIGVQALASAGYLPPLQKFRGFDPVLLIVAPGIGISSLITAIKNLFETTSPQIMFTQGSLSSVYSAIFPFGTGSLTDAAKDIIIPAMPDFFAGVLSPFLGLLLALLLLFLFIRLFFILVRAYIQIIISLIFGPILLLGEAFPGGNAFGQWIGTLAGNLLTFPILSIAFALCYAFSAIADQAASKNTTIWTPPFLTSASADPDARFVAAILSIGVLLALPTIISGVQEKLKTQSVGLGGLFGPAGGIAGTGMTVASMLLSHKYSKDQREAMNALAESIQKTQSAKIDASQFLPKQPHNQ